ncbi:MAG: hypothetical protein IT450_01260 [Phycisphaerales bacterium]|nr:hypothetical protein [Phycisphaerales bacterium]
MPIDLFSTAVGFVAGAITGATGTYLGNRFTDRRREREKSSAERKTFAQIRDQMPALLAEMKADLEREDGRMVREFFVLEKRSHRLGGSSKPRFTYYVEEHLQLHGQLEVLENRGYIIDVTPGNTPVFRMTEEFVESVRKFG